MGPRGALRLLCCGALVLGGGSCLFADAHQRCHQRALEQLGCCPFHGEECEGASLDGIREACADEFSALPGAETGATEDEDEDEGEDADESGGEDSPDQVP